MRACASSMLVLPRRSACTFSSPRLSTWPCASVSPGSTYLPPPWSTVAVAVCAAPRPVIRLFTRPSSMTIPVNDCMPVRVGVTPCTLRSTTVSALTVPTTLAAIRTVQICLSMCCVPLYFLGSSKGAYQLLRVQWQVREAPHADGQIAQLPVVGEIDPSQRHRLHAAHGSGFRNDADADVAFDESADGVEAAQLHAQLEPPSGALRLLRQESLQRAGAIQADEVAIERVSERDALLGSERIACGGHQDEAIDAKRKDFQPGDVFGAGDDADVGLAIGDCGDDLIAQALLEIDVSLGRRGEELAQRLRQEFRERVGVGHQPDVAFQAVGVLAQLAAHALGLLQQQTHVMDERAAGSRR